MKQIDRLASRLLVLAPTGRALMLHLDPGFRAPFWVTPGGGLDAGESFERTFTVAAPDEFEAVVVHAGIEPIVGTNWFSANELRSLEEAVYPEGLAQLVEETTR